MARKSWSELSPAYQKRLTRAGIGQKEHTAGKSIVAARGHKNTPEHNVWRKAAIKADILHSLPGFVDLSPAKAEEVGRQWILGFMSKSAGPLESIKMTDWRYGQKGHPAKVRYQTDAQINARIELLAWLDQNPQVKVTAEDGEFWSKYRQDYMKKFTTKFSK